MSLNYGRPASPEGFIIGKLIPLNLPVEPERDQLTSLPGYVVTAVAPKHDRYLLQATVSVHTFANTRAAAEQAAWNADNLLISLTPGDVITMPDGRPASAWVDPVLAPTFQNYQDPLIKRYVARYDALLRFT
jgi:hypothetical protein